MFQICDGAVMLAFLFIGGAAVAIGHHVLRVQADGLIEIGDAAVNLAFVIIGVAAVDFNFGVIGLVGGPTSTVSVSGESLGVGLAIANARVLSQNSLQLRLANVTLASIVPGTSWYDIAVVS